MGAVKVKKSKKEEYSDHNGKVRCLRCGKGFDPSAEGATSDYGPTCAKAIGASPATSSSQTTLTLVTTPSKIVKAQPQPVQLDIFTDVDPKKIKEMETAAFRKEATEDTEKNLGVAIGVDDEVEVDIEARDAGTDNDYYDTEGNFKWARKSEFENFGEETTGAARHKRNAYRDWQDVVNNAHEAVENRNVLYTDVVKNVQRGMATVVTEENDMDSLILGLILNKFPKKLPEMKDLGDYHQKAKLLITDILALKLQSGNPLDYFNKARALIKERHRSEERGIFKNLCATVHNSLDGGKTAAKNEFMALVDFTNGEKFNYYGWINADEVSKKLSRAKGKMKDSAVRYLKGEGVKKLLGTTKPRVNSSGVKKTPFKHSDFYKGIVPEVKNIRFKGYDDSREFLVKKMKVRGFEFGNSISDAQRPEYARTTAQSFDDLSKITNLSPEQLTGKGELSVLIGVKGVAGSLATYWRGTKDININANSVGSIAHEWGHFIDNHMGNKSGRDYLSNGSSSSVAASDSEKAYQALAPALAEYKYRLKGTDAYRQMSQKSRDTFQSDVEVFARCFESFVNHKANKMKISNNVLVTGVDSELYPNADEIESISEKMEGLLKAFKKEI